MNFVSRGAECTVEQLYAGIRALGPREDPVYQSRPTNPTHDIISQPVQNQPSPPSVQLPPGHTRHRDPTQPLGTQAINVSFDIVIRLPFGTIRIHIDFGPKERITDPTLHRRGIVAHQKLTCRDRGNIQGPYTRQRSDYFRPGIIFACPWSSETEPPSTTSQQLTRPSQQERMFVVVTAGTNCCSAVPTKVYFERERGIDMSDHGAIYTTVAEDRSDSRVRAIRVKTDSPSEKFDAGTLVKYSEIYTIDVDVPVRRVGTVHGDALAPFRTNFANVWQAKLENTSPRISDSPTQARAAQTSAAASQSGNLTAEQARALLSTLMQRGYTRDQAVNHVRARLQMSQAQTTAGHAGNEDNGEEGGEEEDSEDEDEEDDEDDEDQANISEEGSDWNESD